LASAKSSGSIDQSGYLTGLSISTIVISFPSSNLTHISESDLSIMACISAEVFHLNIFSAISSEFHSFSLSPSSISHSGFLINQAAVLFCATSNVPLTPSLTVHVGHDIATTGFTCSHSKAVQF
jgi:hypothetical protein